MNDAIDELALLLAGLSIDPELTDQAMTLMEKLGQSNIVPFQGTKIACHRCGRINAPKYEARRLGQRYVMLCRDEVGGCAGKEILPSCQFVDHDGMPCTQPASHYIITWGDPQDPEDIRHTHTCIQHMGALINDKLGVFQIARHE